MIVGLNNGVIAIYGLDFKIINQIKAHDCVTGL
jgi:hypothetical protein